MIFNHIHVQHIYGIGEIVLPLENNWNNVLWGVQTFWTSEIQSAEDLQKEKKTAYIRPYLAVEGLTLP